MREIKMTNLAVLLPCKSILKFHALRANSVVYLWQNATNPTIEYPPLDENGWIPNGEICWLDNPFPDDLEHLLTVDYDDYECECEVEKDDTDEIKFL